MRPKPPRVPKTPRQRRRDRSRRHILVAARELVLEGGAEHLSLRAVAARADFSPASLYEYFDSKDDLLGELADEVTARLEARSASVPQSLPPAQRLIRYGLAYVAFSRENPEDFLLLFSQLRSRRRSAEQPPAASSPYSRLLMAAREGLQAGAFAAVPGRDAEAIAYGLWAVAHGLAMLQLAHLRGYQADFEVADRLVLEAYVAGLGVGR